MMQRHAHEFLLTIDRVRDASPMLIGEQEEAAVPECFGRLAARDEHRRAQNLGVPRQTQCDWRALWRKHALRARALLPESRNG